MNFQKLCMVLVPFLFLFGCLGTVEIKKVENIPVQSLQASENSKSIQLKKIVIKLKRGEKLGRYFYNCDYAGNIVWGPDPNWKLWEHDPKWGIANRHFSLERDMFTETFNEELENFSFKTVGNTTDVLFEDPSTWKPEILVAGLIQELKANICYYHVNGDTFNNRSRAEVFLKINWQIYSNLDRTLIHTVTSEGLGETEGLGDTNIWMGAGGDFAFYRAFAQATRGLLADKKFREIVSSGQESLK